MDTKNLIAAISLSAAVIIIYALFFGPSPEEIKRSQEQKNGVYSSLKLNFNRRYKVT